MQLIYFSATGNTEKFAQKVDLNAQPIPLRKGDFSVSALEPFILVTPTYGAGGNAGSVPKQVIKFLNQETNRTLLRGVIGGGNRNFGLNFCAAADIVSYKCQIPVLYKFEIFGTTEDVEKVKERMKYIEQKNL